MYNFRKLFENDAVAGIRSPLDYFYMRILKRTLTLVNSWPNTETKADSLIKNGIFNLFLTILTFTYFIGGILNIYFRGKYLSFLDVGYGYISTFMNVVIASRLLTLTFSVKYRDVAKEFITQIHLFYFKDGSDFAMKTHKRIHKFSHIFCLILTSQTVIGIIFFNAVPMYNFFSSGQYKGNGTRNLTLDTSCYITYPFHAYSTTTGYFTIWFSNCIFSSLATIWFCTFDLLLFVIVFHMWGHFSILVNKLDTFPRPYKETYGGSEKYSENELLAVTELLKGCIDYHRLIVGFTKQMSDAFGAMLFVYFMFHQVTGCLLLLECSEMSAAALIRYLPTTIVLNQQLIQLSIIFELIGTTSEKLKHSIYGLPWELMDEKNKRIVFIFLMAVQKPIHVKALGIANVGVTSMATIIKTSLSYFTFLRSM